MGVFRRAGLLALAGLLLPSSALAATINVPADQPTIAAAIAASEDSENDTILIAAGTYAESVTVPEDKPGLTITGADGAKITGAGGDLLTIAATGVKVNTLVFEVPSSASSAVRVTGGATLTGVALASTSPDPLVDVAGTATLVRSLVTRQSGGAGEPAILGNGAGLSIQDSTVLNQTGPAARLDASEENAVVRSTLATTAASGDAVQVAAAAAPARLVVDSSIVIGGGQGTGLRFDTTNQGMLGEAILSELVLRHATVAGAAKGLVLTSSGTGLRPHNIKATIDSSIVHGASEAAGTQLLPTSTVEVDLTNTDTPGFVDNDNPSVSIEETGTSNTADAQLFGNGFRLRADAPVIDKGTAVPADASQTDVDGQPRVNGAASDRGADEFHNSPPKAALTASNANPIQNEAVTFTSTSTDPDAGDAPQGYAWSFGDGSPTVTTTTPSVSHAFPNMGTYVVKLAVADRFGALSQVAELAVTVKDGAPPEIKIVTPRSKARLALNPKKRKGAKRRPRPRPLTAIGTMRDATGVASVELALTFRGTKGKKCRQYTGRSLRRSSCTRFRWVKARLVGDSWSYTTRRGMRLPKGRYDLRARGTDVNGITSSAFTGSGGTLVRFRVR